MTKKEILEKLQEVFREVFDEEELCIDAVTVVREIKDWDSIVQIGLVMGIEKQFQIKFQLNEASALNNVGDMIDFISKKLV